ncbi:hypothetical protein OPT61_g6694 [Boeremia exigua]|uniref:Uncharacterized protein n=1 Tax=Boeremia exigua TaxID=749465 RepID=A0ACC2I547_9PLEO|nr:hypothetical protein OPT61_g6694 [Boeremia exigua]
MSPWTRCTSEVIIARSKRTGERYPARISRFTGDHGSQSTYVHYTDDRKIQACRCSRLQDHERPHRVSSDDKILAIGMTSYMERFNLELVDRRDFNRYYEGKKIQWALKSVHAERFHYLSKHKDIVCRCCEPDHSSCRRVRNPDVQDSCAEYFLLQTTQTTCTRDQWRATQCAEPKPPKELLRRLHAETSKPLISRTTERFGSFGYDSPSVIDLLQAREARSLDSKEHRQHHAPKQNATSTSDREDIAHLKNGMNGEADIPEDIWRNSHPSVYLGQHNTESCTSTPVGSLVTPVQPVGHPNSLLQDYRSSTPQLGAEAVYVSRYADICYDAASTSSIDRLTDFSNSRTKSPSRDGIGSCGSESEAASLEESFSEWLKETPPRSRPGSLTVPTHIAELPSLERAVELDTVFMHPLPLSQHSTALPELECGRHKSVAELTGRSCAAASRTSNTTCSPRRLTRLIDQPLWDGLLPCQEDFLLQQVEICSRAHPAPIGDCSLCSNSLRAPNKRSLRITCGHYVHLECLISSFRISDHEFGNCPVCGMALCERTLHDRIDTDREAIFGNLFTNLKTEERIGFPQRSESVVCWSEEEVAAARLRLLKDYVDSHADEVYRQWRQTGLQPDWHNAVVIPVVQLFKGWSGPTQKCRYFVDRDAFYKLIVWAELVRVMNTTRDGERRIHGSSAPFPLLSELHPSAFLTGVPTLSVVVPQPTENSGTSNDLPSQQSYLKDLLPSESEPLVPQKPDASCGICLESFAESVSISAAHPTSKVVVELKSCRHLFHYGCILRWHTSLRPERNTCPNCRQQLFNADPFTAEQAQRLADEARIPLRNEALARLQTNEMIVPEEVLTTRVLTQEGVDCIVERVGASHFRGRIWGHPWIAFCEHARDTILQVGGPLRPVFQPHRDKFVFVVVAAMLLVQITRYPSATQRPAFQRLVDMTDHMIDEIGEEEYRTLYREFRDGGLFLTDRYATVRVTGEQIRVQIEAAARIRLVSADLESQKEVQGLNRALRRAAHLTLTDIVNEYPQQTQRTLSAVLNRVADGGSPHFLTYDRGSRLTGDHVLDIGWENMLALDNNSGLVQSLP